MAWYTHLAAIMNATARTKGNMKTSLAIRRSIHVQWQEAQWACAIRKKPACAQRSGREWQHAAAVAGFLLLCWSAPAQTLINIDFGVGPQSAKVGPAATG